MNDYEYDTEESLKPIQPYKRIIHTGPITYQIDVDDMGTMKIGGEAKKYVTAKLTHQNWLPRERLSELIGTEVEGIPNTRITGIESFAIGGFSQGAPIAIIFEEVENNA